MNSFFTAKSLSFYGGTIAAVALLFWVATAYGEAHLQAPRKIEGRYRLVAPPLPGCLKPSALTIVVKQSGIYLTAALVPQTATEAQIKTAEERPSLSGRWDNHRLALDGETKLLGCQEKVSIAGVIPPVSQSGGDRAMLNGTLRLESTSERQDFTAEQEAPPPSSKEH